MTAPTTSRGRKRSRREEEDTPPRPTLDELEREDRAQQHMTPNRPVSDQPQERMLLGGTASGLSHPAHQQGRAGGAQPQQAEGQEQQLVTPGKSVKKQQGQSCITNFLTAAPQSSNTDTQLQQREASHIPSLPGETLFIIAW